MAGLLRNVGKGKEGADVLRTAFTDGVKCLGPKHRSMRSIAQKATGIKLPENETIVAMF